MYANETDGFGTLRKKSGLPSDFWSWKPQKGLGISPMIQYHDGKLMVRQYLQKLGSQLTEELDDMSDVN